MPLRQEVSFPSMACWRSRSFSVSEYLWFSGCHKCDTIALNLTLRRKTPLLINRTTNSLSSRPHPVKSSLNPLTRIQSFLKNDILQPLIPFSELFFKAKSLDKNGKCKAFFRFSSPFSNMETTISLEVNRIEVFSLVSHTLDP